MRFKLQNMATTLLVVGGCENYNCADLAKCSTPSTDAGPTNEIRELDASIPARANETLDDAGLELPSATPTSSASQASTESNSHLPPNAGDDSRTTRDVDAMSEAASSAESKSTSASPQTSITEQSCNDSEYRAETGCRLLTICESDEYQDVAPTAIADRSCKTLSECAPGTYESVAPTVDSDRRCSDCPDGTFTNEPNAVGCPKWTECKLGEVELEAPSPARDRVCGPKPVCQPGSYVDSTTTVCTACPDYTFTSGTNAETCTPWHECEEGESESVMPNATRDRVCSVCGANKFDHSGTCLDLTICSNLQFEAMAPTGTSDRACVDLSVCDVEEYESTAPTAFTDRVCSAVRNCTQENEYESRAPSPTSDRECTPCPADSRVGVVNSPYCGQVTAGDSHSCYVAPGLADLDEGDTTTSNLGCWGNDGGGRTNRPAGNFVSLSAGHDFTCGLTHDGTVRCWGANPEISSNPKPNVFFTRISAGADSVCGLKEDGGLECWGKNQHGQATPPSEKVYSALDGGSAHCALRTDTQRVDCWGSVDHGGAPSFPESAVLDVTSGSYTAVLLAAAQDGVRPIYFAGKDSELPGSTRFPTMMNFKDIEAGSKFMCGIIDAPGQEDDGYPWCWADDGNLDGNVNSQWTRPKYRVIQLAAGINHVCALSTDARPNCWGLDNFDNTIPPF